MARDEKASAAERERSLYVLPGGAKGSKPLPMSLGRLLESLSLAPLTRSLTADERRTLVLYRSVNLPEIENESSGVRQAVRNLLREIRNLWRFTPDQRRHRLLLLRSPLFDDLYYISCTPELPGTGQRPVDHYLLSRAGDRRAAAERSAHPLFLPDFYRATVPQRSALSDIDPLRHFLTASAEDRGEPHPLFNGRYYLHTYPDVRSAGVNPLEHYLLIGAREGRNPHPLFDTRFYLSQLSDAEQREGLVNPLVHYVLQGAARGLNPHPLFSSEFYLAQLERRGGVPEQRTGSTPFNPLVHFLTCDPRDRAQPHPLFDAAHYERQLPPAELGETNPLVHYLVHGRENLHNPHPLFDTQFYLNSYPDVRRQGINPLLHYLIAGSHESRDPSPEFDGRYYAERYPDFQGSGLSALEHHVRYGVTERRTVRRFNPSELLVAQWEEAIALEPSIKSRGFEHLIQAPLIRVRHSTIGDAFDWVAARMPAEATHLFFVSGAADPHATRELGAILDSLTGSVAHERIALVATEGPAADFPRVRRCALGDIPYPLSETDRIEVLKLLVLHLTPRITHCIGSTAGWDLFQRYGRPLSTLTALCGSLFLDEDGRVAADHPVPPLTELWPLLTAVLVDDGTSYERFKEASGLTRALLAKVIPISRTGTDGSSPLPQLCQIDGYLNNGEGRV